MTNLYEVQVWQDRGEWHAVVYVVNEVGQRVHELDGVHRHEYLLNTMNYAGQEIVYYEREGGNA
jgi:hypothetical protein